MVYKAEKQRKKHGDEVEFEDSHRYPMGIPWVSHGYMALGRLVWSCDMQKMLKKLKKDVKSRSNSTNWIDLDSDNPQYIGG